MPCQSHKPGDNDPNKAWTDYAFRSGLLNEGGIAPNPVQAQTAYYAFTAAWNAAVSASRSYAAPALEERATAGVEPSDGGQR
jgi:hypothetical protein